MAMSGLTRIAEYIPATEVTVARTWDAMSLTSLGYTEENITGKQPLRTLGGIHMDTIQNKTNMMYIAMTVEEFTSWTQNGELKHIHGWARSPEVEYIVLNSSPFEAVTTLLNYISVGTCRTQHLGCEAHCRVGIPRLHQFLQSGLQCSTHANSHEQDMDADTRRAV